MKRILSLLMCLCIAIGGISTTTLAKANTPEMRAVWISTVFNLDYPSTKNNPAAQKQEFIQILDQLQSVGINTVVVQVRPKGDALYRSKINPWSDVLTGTQGMDPGYDPMAFMIEEAHKRGMTFHAWLNPYRVTTSGTDLNQLSINHPARLNPSMLITHNNALYYNPELPEVKQHIVDTVEEIVKNYDVDGVHYDDYFYPSGYPLPSGETRDGIVANKRREDVNDMVRKTSKIIEATNPNVLFGISPGGIWKNALSDFSGSNTNGSESYYSVYADTRTWIQNEWVDYIVPQIYWETGHKLADYETLVSWWSQEVEGTDVGLYIGQAIYKDAVASEIDKQLIINTQYDVVKGSFYFSLRDLLKNRMDCRNKIKSVYQQYPIAPSEPEEKPMTPDQVVGKQGKVIADTLNVRSGARTDRPVVAKLTKQSQVTILSMMPGWYKVKLTDGTTGWASSDYIKVDLSSTTGPIAPTPDNTNGKVGTVTVEGLNVRSGPNTTNSIVTNLKKGSQVTILELQGKWYKIKLSDGKIGWVAKEYISR